MAYETLIVQDHDRSVAICLNRPAQLNSISLQMIIELTDVLDLFANREQLCAVSITGAGRAFCSGVDLKSAQDRISQEGGSDANYKFLDLLRILLLKVENYPVPVIAAVNGYALAGGLELVLACDLIIAAKSAKFGDAHANYGLVPGGGSSARLPRKIGPTRAKQLIFSGEFLAAEQMLGWGLVNWVVDNDLLANELENQIHTLSQKSPIGLRRMKQMVNDGLEQPLEKALKTELLLNAQHANSADRLEGLAAFAGKRQPDFKGY